MPVMENNAELTYACNEFQLSGLSYCKSIVKKDLEMLGAWDVVPMDLQRSDGARTTIPSITEMTFAGLPTLAAKSRQAFQYVCAPTHPCFSI